MSCYLLTWKPEIWSEEEFAEYYARYEKNETVRWSCGNTQKILAGDTFYLLKQGKDGPGIIGSGVITSPPFGAPHYVENRADKGEMALYVDIKFDYLAQLRKPVPIRRDELSSPGLSSKIWSAQGSGKTIPEEIEFNLTELWHSRFELNDFTYPEEISVKGTYEGARKKITVNSYERNAEARRKCLEKWNYNCAVCNFHFELYYGPIGKKYIHVHHLYPISSIGKEYEIDPVNDLRPVCPNCHAMLHKENPPLSIEELQRLIKSYGVKMTNKPL